MTDRVPELANLVLVDDDAPIDDVIEALAKAPR